MMFVMGSVRKTREMAQSPLYGPLAAAGEGGRGDVLVSRSEVSPGIGVTSLALWTPRSRVFITVCCCLRLGL